MSERSRIILTVSDLSRAVGRRYLLRKVSFEALDGELIALVGRNGAGKTTLLSLVARRTPLDEGEVTLTVNGKKVNGQTYRAKTGFLPHDLFIYPDLTARENLEFYARMYDVPDRSKRIQELVTLVGMAHRLNDRVATFSRGMQQRLSIARALLHRPSLMLLDEPETGLDQEANTMLWEALRGGETGTIPTIILTTHSLERGLEQCSRLLILVQGQIACEASKQALKLDDLKQLYRHHTGVNA